MLRWGRWAWWGLAGLGAVVLVGGLWVSLQGRVVGSGAHSSPRLAAAGRRSAPGISSPTDSAPEIGLVGGRSLQSALTVSFLDTGPPIAAAAPRSATRPLLAPADEVHLARTSGGLRTVPEAPGLVLLGLAALAAAQRRAAGRGGSLASRPS